MAHVKIKRKDQFVTGHVGLRAIARNITTLSRRMLSLDYPRGDGTVWVFRPIGSLAD
jgi:hypothetical protein